MCSFAFDPDYDWGSCTHCHSAAVVFTSLRTLYSTSKPSLTYSWHILLFLAGYLGISIFIAIVAYLWYHQRGHVNGKIVMLARLLVSFVVLIP